MSRTFLFVLLLPFAVQAQEEDIQCKKMWAEKFFVNKAGLYKEFEALKNNLEEIERKAFIHPFGIDLKPNKTPLADALLIKNAATELNEIQYEFGSWAEIQACSEELAEASAKAEKKNRAAEAASEAAEALGFLNKKSTLWHLILKRHLLNLTGESGDKDLALYLKLNLLWQEEAYKTTEKQLAKGQLEAYTAKKDLAAALDQTGKALEFLMEELRALLMIESAGKAVLVKALSGLDEETRREFQANLSELEKVAAAPPGERREKMAAELNKTFDALEKKLSGNTAALAALRRARERYQASMAALGPERGKKKEKITLWNSSIPGKEIFLKVEAEPARPSKRIYSEGLDVALASGILDLPFVPKNSALDIWARRQAHLAFMEGTAAQAGWDFEQAQRLDISGKKKEGLLISMKDDFGRPAGTLFDSGDGLRIKTSADGKDVEFVDANAHYLEQRKDGKKVFMKKTLPDGSRDILFHGKEFKVPADRELFLVNNAQGDVAAVVIAKGKDKDGNPTDIEETVTSEGRRRYLQGSSAYVWQANGARPEVVFNEKLPPAELAALPDSLMSLEAKKKIAAFLKQGHDYSLRSALQDANGHKLVSARFQDGVLDILIEWPNDKENAKSFYKERIGRKGWEDKQEEYKKEIQRIDAQPDIIQQRLMLDLNETLPGWQGTNNYQSDKQPYHQLYVSYPSDPQRGTEFYGYALDNRGTRIQYDPDSDYLEKGSPYKYRPMRHQRMAENGVWIDLDRRNDTGTPGTRSNPFTSSELMAFKRQEKLGKVMEFAFALPQSLVKEIQALGISIRDLEALDKKIQIHYTECQARVVEYAAHLAGDDPVYSCYRTLKDKLSPEEWKAFQYYVDYAEDSRHNLYGIIPARRKEYNDKYERMKKDNPALYRTMERRGMVMADLQSTMNAPISEAERASRAGAMFGMGNTWNYHIAQGRYDMEHGDVASGFLGYAAGGGGIAAEMYAEGLLFGGMTRSLYAVAAGKSTGLSLQQINSMLDKERKLASLSQESQRLIKLMDAGKATPQMGARYKDIVKEIEAIGKFSKQEEKARRWIQGLSRGQHYALSTMVTPSVAMPFFHMGEAGIEGNWKEAWDIFDQEGLPTIAMYGGGIWGYFNAFGKRAGEWSKLKRTDAKGGEYVVEAVKAQRIMQRQADSLQKFNDKLRQMEEAGGKITSEDWVELYRLKEQAGNDTQKLEWIGENGAGYRQALRQMEKLRGGSKEAPKKPQETAMEAVIAVEQYFALLGGESSKDPQVQRMGAILRQLQRDIRSGRAPQWAELPMGEAGKRTNPNGGTSYLNMDLADPWAAAFVLLHETSHGLQARRGGSFDKISGEERIQREIDSNLLEARLIKNMSEESYQKLLSQMEVNDPLKAKDFKLSRELSAEAIRKLVELTYGKEFGEAKSQAKDDAPRNGTSMFEDSMKVLDTKIRELNEKVSRNEKLTDAEKAELYQLAQKAGKVLYVFELSERSYHERYEAAIDSIKELTGEIEAKSLSKGPKGLWDYVKGWVGGGKSEGIEKTPSQNNREKLALGGEMDLNIVMGGGNPAYLALIQLAVDPKTGRIEEVEHRNPIFSQEADRKIAMKEWVEVGLKYDFRRRGFITEAVGLDKLSLEGRPAVEQAIAARNKEVVEKLNNDPQWKEYQQAKARGEEYIPPWVKENPNRVISEKEVLEFLGVDPMEVDGQRLGGNGGARKINLFEKGEWVIKDVKINKNWPAADNEISRRSMQNEILMRNLMAEFKSDFPDLEMPEGFMYQRANGQIVFLTRYRNAERNDALFFSLDARVQRQLAVLALGFGLADINHGNILFRDSGKAVLIDAESIGRRGPIAASVERVEGKIVNGHAPFVNRDRGAVNDWAAYLKEAGKWKQRLEDPAFRKRLEAAMERSGLSPPEIREYMDTVLKNFENFKANLKAYERGLENREKERNTPEAKSLAKIERMGKKIGEGSTAEIFEAEMMVDGKLQKAAVKVPLPGMDSYVGGGEKFNELAALMEAGGVRAAVPEYWGPAEAGGRKGYAMRHVESVSPWKAIRMGIYTAETQKQFEAAAAALSEKGYIYADFTSNYQVLTKDQVIRGKAYRKGDIVLLDPDALQLKPEISREKISADLKSHLGLLEMDRSRQKIFERLSKEYGISKEALIRIEADNYAEFFLAANDKQWEGMFRQSIRESRNKGIPVRSDGVVEIGGRAMLKGTHALEIANGESLIFALGDGIDKNTVRVERLADGLMRIWWPDNQPKMLRPNETVTVGRKGSGKDIEVEGDSVSENHLKLTFKDGALTVEETSQKGTRIGQSLTALMGPTGKDAAHPLKRMSKDAEYLLKLPYMEKFMILEEAKAKLKTEVLTPKQEQEALEPHENKHKQKILNDAITLIQKSDLTPEQRRAELAAFLTTLHQAKLIEPWRVGFGPKGDIYWRNEEAGPWWRYDPSSNRMVEAGLEAKSLSKTGEMSLRELQELAKKTWKEKKDAYDLYHQERRIVSRSSDADIIARFQRMKENLALDGLELLESSDGAWFFTQGRDFDGALRKEPIGRFFISADGAAAETLIKDIARMTAKQGCFDFQIKTYAWPEYADARSDSIVLYVPDRYRKIVFENVLKVLAERSPERFRDSKPMMTLKLARGVSYGEEPGDHSVSFGQMRGKAIEEAIREAQSQGITSTESPEFQKILREKLFKHNVDPDHPWLNTGSYEKKTAAAGK